ncbi:MAG TPA: bacteriocin [Flavobacteriales bacterium]|nr:bacteriocin [Flavobacteriales bacterium]
MIKDPDELTDEQLENVIGGASREVFLNWAADIYNAHRKKQYDKKTNEERKWTRND